MISPRLQIFLFFLLPIFLLLACTTSPDSDEEKEGTTATGISWVFVDEDQKTGINYVTGNDAQQPVLTSYNSNLFAIWSENNNSWNVRTASYDGETTWNFEDGNTSAGLNYGSGDEVAADPEFIEFESKLYATWSEDGNVHVREYNGSDWTFFDGGANGINRNAGETGSNPHLVVHNSSLYGIWSEVVTGSFNAKQIRVSKWEGDTSWDFIDGNSAHSGINRDSHRDAINPYMVSFQSKLYAIWSEEDSGGYYKVRVKEYNDTSDDWNFVDGDPTNDGINKNKSDGYSVGVEDYKPQIVELESELYATWVEDVSSGAGYGRQIRLAKWNGDASWDFVDGDDQYRGLNYDASRDASNPSAVSFQSKMFVTWNEEDSSSNGQIRVAQYDPSADSSSDIWSFVDGNTTTGINKDTSEDANDPNIFVFDNNLFITWSEEDAGVYQIRVAKGVLE
ncbi:MAG: hypothetical protein GY786_03265 [Proteobacteria bacterium]|nr:hypothetical protein [Pseudomonadota bacterium]